MTPQYVRRRDGSGRRRRERALQKDGGAGASACASRGRRAWCLVSGGLSDAESRWRRPHRLIVYSHLGGGRSRRRVRQDPHVRPHVRTASSFASRQRIVPAQRLSLVRPVGKLGMTICYDLRFPGLFRSLAQAGSNFISVPSSFQRQTAGSLATACARSCDRERVLYFRAGNVRRSSGTARRTAIPLCGSTLGRNHCGRRRIAQYRLCGIRSHTRSESARDDSFASSTVDFYFLKPRQAGCSAACGADAKP